MIIIKAFKAYRYNKEKAAIQDVITPPYDVIDDDMKRILKNKSEFNFVNIILNESHDKAKELLNEWIKKSILVQDREDSIYVYQHEFKLDNKKFKRTGIVCLLKLEELGNNILPHEQTFEKYINDRYSLMEKTKANLENIFMIYQDKSREIDNITIPLTEKDEDLKFVDDDNCAHKIYRISSKEAIEKIKKSVHNKKLLIADGHHRYKTALRYKNNYDYVMATLVNSENEGLIIFPINRIVDKKINIDDFKEHFNIKETNNLIFKEKSFVVATKESKYLIELKQKNEALDVEILHNLIFKDILKIPLEEQKPPKISFYKGNKATLAAINENNTGFFVNPPKLEKVFKIANNNKILPQKSTYFYPKMFSGLLINRF